MISFHQVRDYLIRNGSVKLPYLTNPKVIFTASAGICSKGKNKHKPAIKIESGDKNQTYILIYEDDWGKRYALRGTKSKGTLIYHACEPLAE